MSSIIVWWQCEFFFFFSPFFSYGYFIVFIQYFLNVYLVCSRRRKMEMSTDIMFSASTVDLDYILMQLDAISETLDQLEGVNNSNDLAKLIDTSITHLNQRQFT